MRNNGRIFPKFGSSHQFTSSKISVNPKQENTRKECLNSHIRDKQRSTKNTEKGLKVAKGEEEKLTKNRVTIMEMTADFSSETVEARARKQSLKIASKINKPI